MKTPCQTSPSMAGRSVWRRLHVLRRDHQTCQAALTADSDPLPEPDTSTATCCWYGRLAAGEPPSTRRSRPARAEATYPSINWLNFLSARKQCSNKIITSKRLRLKIHKPIPKETRRNAHESMKAVTRKTLDNTTRKLVLPHQQHNFNSWTNDEWFRYNVFNWKWESQKMPPQLICTWLLHWKFAIKWKN